MTQDHPWARVIRRTGLREAERLQLWRLPLFQGLADEVVADLIDDATVRDFRRGTLLFGRDDPADRFYVVLQGWVKLSRETKDGHESVIGLFSQGESFGEAAMFESELFPVDGTVIDDSRLLVVPASSFRRRLLAQPELMFTLIGSMSRHMRRLVQQIEQLTARTSAERVAAFLAGLVNGAVPPVRIHLPVDKVLIAGRLGMQPETFSRALARLRDHGVTVQGSDVVITDPGRLNSFAEGELRRGA